MLERWGEVPTLLRYTIYIIVTVAIGETVAQLLLFLV
jgi:hypothetical protein